jgi:hypothetical protein
MESRERLRFCAFCPAPCRSATPRDDTMQDETTTPSSLSLIVLAVEAGQLPLDDAVTGALRNTRIARHCTAACPYHHDIVSDIEAFLDLRGASRQAARGA